MIFVQPFSFLLDTTSIFALSLTDLRLYTRDTYTNLLARTCNVF